MWKASSCLLASWALLGCSNPSCPDGQLKIGKTCIALSDAGHHGDSGSSSDASSWSGEPDASSVASHNGQQDGGASLEAPDGSAGTGLTISASLNAVKLSFDTAIDPASVTNLSVRISRESVAVSGKLTTSENSVTFTPDAPLALGVMYQVAVAASLLSKDGTSVPATSVSFTTRDGTWNTSKFEPGCCFSGLAMNASGHAVLGFGLRDPTSDYVTLRLSSFAPDTGIAASVTTPAMDYAQFIKLSINAAGRVGMAWTKDALLHVGSWTPETGWVALNQNNAQALAVVIDSANRVYVDSADYGQSGLAVMQRSFVAAAVLDVVGPDGIAPDESNPVGKVGAVALLNGLPYSVWESSPTAGPILGTYKSTSFTLTISDASASANNPVIAVDENDLGAIVGWEQAGSVKQIFARRMPRTGTAPPPVQVSRATLEASSPQVAVDASGRAIMVWQEKLASGSQIVAAHFDIASGWAAPVVLSASSVGPASSPSVTMEPGGNAVVLYQQAEGAGTKADVFAARFTVDGGFNPQPTMLWQGGVMTVPPLVGSDSSGRALAIWGADEFIWQARFE